MIIDIENRSSELRISYINKEGDVKFLIVPVNKPDKYVWQPCRADDPKKDDTFLTWDNKHVKKESTEWVGNKPSQHRLNKYRINEILTNKPDQAAILNEFNIPKKYFIDIEVEVLDGFPTPETALNRVTSIAIASASTKLIMVLGLKDLSREQMDSLETDINQHFSKFNDKWTFRYIKYETEYDMLYTFFHTLIPKFPCISGWNIIGYDWKYLLNRCDRINSTIPTKEKINTAMASPSQRLMGRDRLPQHRLIVDYMEIYKKWDKVIKVRENDKLDYVGLQAVGVQKVKYPGSFKDLYEKDFYKFIFYNAVDSILVHYIDQKLNTMITFLKLAHIAQIEINKAFSPIWIMEAVMCREFLKENKVFIYTEDKDGAQVAFEGAYVKEPLVGFHNWVTCYDFASLYPNTMMQYNISPETFIGKDVEPKEGEIKVGEHPNPKIPHQMTWGVFRNDEDSILRKILVSYYGKRKETKKKYLAINKEIDFLKKQLTN